jgi:hypothetical protein
MSRALEPPSAEEGFDAIEVVAFQRVDRADAQRACCVFSLGALGAAALRLEADEEAARAVAEVSPDTPCFIYAWLPGMGSDALERGRAFAEAIARASGRQVEIAVCTHPAGPPVCWCRPPLPGLWLAFAFRHGALARASTLVGATAADRAMARALGMAWRRTSDIRAVP